MSCVTYTDLRQNLARHMDDVVDSRTPLTITRQGGKGNVIMMSEEEFEGWQETVHLLSSPKNAQRLLDAVRELDAGGGSERQLLQPQQAEHRLVKP